MIGQPDNLYTFLSPPNYHVSESPTRFTQGTAKDHLRPSPHGLRSIFIVRNLVFLPFLSLRYLKQNDIHYVSLLCDLG